MSLMSKSGYSSNVLCLFLAAVQVIYRINVVHWVQAHSLCNLDQTERLLWLMDRNLTWLYDLDNTKIMMLNCTLCSKLWKSFDAGASKEVFVNVACRGHETDAGA